MTDRELLDGIVDLAVEAYDHWDNDRDANVGKILRALAGLLPGYDARADAFHDRRSTISAADAALGFKRSKK